MPNFKKPRGGFSAKFLARSPFNAADASLVSGAGAAVGTGANVGGNIASVAGQAAGGVGELAKHDWSKKKNDETNNEESTENAENAENSEVVVNENNEVVENPENTEVETSTYEVQKGDNLSKIAKANNMTLDELLEKNPEYKENPNFVRSGATLNL